MVCFKQTILLKIFKGSLPQILLGPFMNTLNHGDHCLLLLHSKQKVTLVRALTWKQILNTFYMPCVKVVLNFTGDFNKGAFITRTNTLSDKKMWGKSDEIFQRWRKFCPTKNFVQKLNSMFWLVLIGTHIWLSSDVKPYGWSDGNCKKVNRNVNSI